MATKTVLDVGNCSFDHGAIRRLIEGRFDAVVLRAHGPEDALAALANKSVDLVLVNRILDRDGSDGIELIRQIKSNPALAELPVMLVSNYEEYQEKAIQAGAERGFGKAELEAPETLERLGAVLG